MLITTAAFMSGNLMQLLKLSSMVKLKQRDEKIRSEGNFFCIQLHNVTLVILCATPI